MKRPAAATPEPLCRWWIRYLCPPGGTVLDPFCGSGTVGLVALQEGRAFIGIEKEPRYVEMARGRIGAIKQGHLFGAMEGQP